MIKISKRLKEIANYVEDNSNIVDIGCDHGILDIYLIQNKKNIKIIASDINQNALNNAIKNIKREKLENKIKTVLSNGLEEIDTTNIDTLIISGMGTHTIVGILYNNLKKLKKIKTLIIQSNNDLDFLRYKLKKIGFIITGESLIKDAGIIYTVIKFNRGLRIYTKKQLYLGPYLLKIRNSLFIEKSKLELEKLEKIYPMIPKNHFSYRNKIKWKIKTLKKVLNKSFK